MPAEPSIRVEIVDGALTRSLRRAVLRPELSPDEALPGDGLDGVVHFAALAADGAVLSTCFVFPQPCPWQPAETAGWHLRQMATAPPQRRLGLGGAVVGAVVAHVADQGGGILWCNARADAVGLYQRAGLTGHGDIFTDEVHTIPHLRMWRRVS